MCSLRFFYPRKRKSNNRNGIFQPCQTILAEENVQYNPKVVAELINKHFPDWRRILNELQRYSAKGEIDTGILAEISDVNINELTDSLKNKEYNKVRKWVVANLDNDFNFVTRRLYDSFYDTMVSSSIPAAVLTIAKYQYQAAFAADQEINLLACLTEIMMECEFK